METYNAADVVDKTLIATKRIPVFKEAVDNAQSTGWVEAGQPVGVVYAWLNPNPGVGRSKLWWSFWPVNGMYYYAPHEQGNFSVSALRSQGVISTDEKVKQEQEKLAAANRTWYQQLLHEYWWIPVVGIGIATLPGIIRATR